MRVIIVGIGGVGTRLARELPMYLARRHPGAEVVLVDGDIFEKKNRDRQDFDAVNGIGVNKAAMWAETIKAQFPELVVTSRDEFVTPRNVEEFIPDDSYVFCCVDNHASRKLLSERVSALKSTVLLSGGNDYHDGNIQIQGAPLADGTKTPPITYLHPEIANPTDKNPAEMSCEERAAAGSPQLQNANLKVAGEMFNAFYLVTEGVDLRFSEVYFDIHRGTQRPIMRREENGSPEANEADLADRHGGVSAAAAVAQG